MEDKECLCQACACTTGDGYKFLDNGYCEECFDQGCDSEDDVH